MDSAEAHAQRAFDLLGKADAVIANLLHDPTDQVARVQAQLWQRELEVLDLLADQVGTASEEQAGP